MTSQNILLCFVFGPNYMNAILLTLETEMMDLLISYV